VTALDLTGLDLPPLFTPAQAAEILRSLGMTEMTECALRTRAYRRQVPFHLNGRRIRFTASDLREIAEGQPSTPQPPLERAARPPRLRSAPRRTSAPSDASGPQAWRAHEPADRPTGSREQAR
jgi:hypothetical protein